MSDETILYSSVEAAKFVENISGWVDRHGFFYGKNEDAARYSGCTHRPCRDCGSPTRKAYLSCETCRDKKEIEKYFSMPKKEWDGVGMIYSDYADEYFSDFQEIKDYMQCNEIESIDQMRLIICEPNYLSPIDEAQWADDRPEEVDLPQTIIDAIEIFNKAIKNEPPVSWSPGKFAAIFNARTEK